MLGAYDTARIRFRTSVLLNDRAAGHVRVKSGGTLHQQYVPRGTTKTIEREGHVARAVHPTNATFNRVRCMICTAGLAHPF